MLYDISMKKQDMSIRVDRLKDLIDKKEKALKRKVSYGEIKEQAGVAKSQMSLVLNEKRPNVWVDTLAALAVYFDVSMDYLMGLTDNQLPYDRDGKPLHEEAKETAILVDNMRPERRQDVLAIVRALEEQDRSAVGTAHRYDRLLAQAKLVYGEEYVLQVIADLARGVDDATADSSVSQE